ncbi:MAG: hypothetical protein R3C11_20880 [Planctomycetaceae bacterium]
MRILISVRDQSSLPTRFIESVEAVLADENQIAQIKVQSTFPDLQQIEEQDLILIWLDSPDQFSRQQVEGAIGLNPLVRWLSIYGPWSEGDGRNRDIWPMAVRVPWRRFQNRLRQEISIYQDRLPTLPITASRNECFLFDQLSFSGIEWNSNKSHLQVGLVMDDFSLAEYLMKLLQRAGGQVSHHTTAELHQELQRNVIYERHPRIWMFDLDPWSHARAHFINQLIQSIENSLGFIGLTNEINPELDAEFRKAGIEIIATKLMGESELLRTLRQSVSL